MFRIAASGSPTPQSSSCGCGRHIRWFDPLFSTKFHLFSFVHKSCLSEFFTRSAAYVLLSLGSSKFRPSDSRRLVKSGSSDQLCLSSWFEYRW